MPKIKLRGPRRPEEGRITDQTELKSPTESKSPTADVLSMEIDRPASRRSSTVSGIKSTSRLASLPGSPVSTKAAASKSSSTPEDTIRVTQQNIVADDVANDSDNGSELTDLDRLEQDINAETSASVQTSRPSSSKGKGPVRDLLRPESVVDDSAMLDVNDDVEEYPFSSESEKEEPEEVFDTESEGEDNMELFERSKTKPTVIEILDDDDDMTFDPSSPHYRPWRGCNADQRYQYELMFCNVIDRPKQNDLDYTEDLQRELDGVMHLYIKDFPIEQWVVAPAVARNAHERLQGRDRWRGLGIRIYGHPERSPMHEGQFRSALQLQSTMHVDLHKYPREAGAMHASQHMRPPPVPSHQQMQRQHQAMSQRAPYGMQHNMQMQPPPGQVLRSQPDAPPFATRANGMSMHHTMGQPGMPTHTIDAGMNGHSAMYGPHQPMQPPPSGRQSGTQKGRKPRENAKKTQTETPLVEPSAPPPPPVPPYEKREKPADRHPKPKFGRRNSTKRQAEAEDFPWNREIDFVAAKRDADWDDSIYDDARLADMAVTRAKNKSVVTGIDDDERERQKETRNNKKKAQAEGASDADLPKRQSRKKQPAESKEGDSSTGDPYHSGHFAWATDEAREKASKLELSSEEKTPMEFIDAAEAGDIPLESCADLMVSWNPGKKGSTHKLEQARFSVKDVVVTLRQIDQREALTEIAGQRIVDFCPHLLWREYLLRISSEAGLGNKDIRDRMSCNGNHADKATITKRIGAALGQKQQQAPTRMKKGKPQTAAETAKAKARRDAREEDEAYYIGNAEDFDNYTLFFGKRTSHRTQAKTTRKGQMPSSDSVSVDAAERSGAEGVAGPSKKRKKREETTESPEAMELDGSDEEESGATTGAEADSDFEGEDEKEDEDVGDAVSVQSDTMLDAMDED